MPTLATQNLVPAASLDAAESHTAHWIQIVSHLDPKYGGLSAAVPALSSALAGSGRYSVSLAGFCQTGEHFSPPPAPGVSTQYFPVGRSAWISNGTTRKAFRQLVRDAAGVHIHGLWQMSTSVAAHTAQASKKPYLISARGMLESWALANKKLKKTLYAALFERRNLRSATCLHALTEAEANDYRRFGLTNPIAVIPNGVAVIFFFFFLPPDASSEPFLIRFPALRDKRLMLFLGRLHAKKGLDLLTTAWVATCSQWPEAHLVLAGPDSDGTQARVEKQLDELGIRNRVTFTGMLMGDLKWGALASAESFVLPSYSEGLSVSVLEAMGMGLPVVITRQCNSPHISQAGCGWTIEPDSEQLACALRDLLTASAADRSSFGKNGRRLVARRYSWPVIAEQMTALFDWIAGGGPAPRNLNLLEGKGL